MDSFLMGTSTSSFKENKTCVGEYVNENFFESNKLEKLNK